MPDRDPVLESTGLADRIDVVKAGPSRETWLLRLLSAAMGLVIVLVSVVIFFAVRIDGRAERTKTTAEARDAESTDRERAQARALEAFRRLVVATTPEDRASARAALESATIPDPATTTTTRSRSSTTTTTTTTPTAASTTTTVPPTTTTATPPNTSTTTTAPPRTCTTRPVLGCLPTDP